MYLTILTDSQHATLLNGLDPVAVEMAAIRAASSREVAIMKPEAASLALGMGPKQDAVVFRGVVVIPNRAWSIHWVGEYSTTNLDMVPRTDVYLKEVAPCFAELMRVELIPDMIETCIAGYLHCEPAGFGVASAAKLAARRLELGL